MKLLEAENITTDNSPACFAFRYLWTMAKLAEEHNPFVAYVTGPPSTQHFKVELDCRGGHERDTFRASALKLVDAWENEIGVGIFPISTSMNISPSTIQVVIRPVGQ